MRSASDTWMSSVVFPALGGDTMSARGQELQIPAEVELIRSDAVRSTVKHFDERPLAGRIESRGKNEIGLDFAVFRSSEMDVLHVPPGDLPGEVCVLAGALLFS